MTDQSASQDAVQAAQQAAQAASQAAQRAEQVAQAIAQEVQALKQAVQSGGQAAYSVPGGFIGAEREAETGMDDAFKDASINQTRSWDANVKRTYDEFQGVSLVGIRDSHQLMQRLAQLSVDGDNQVRNVSLQALQNAVETANLLGKQAVAHRDIAIKSEWSDSLDG